VPIAAIGLWLVYAVLGAVLLPAHLEARAHRIGLDLDIGQVRTVVPGRLQLRNATIADPANGWLVSVPRATVEVDLSDLLSGAPNGIGFVGLVGDRPRSTCRGVRGHGQLRKTG
jgi:hypothetical protein